MTRPANETHTLHEMRIASRITSTVITKHCNTTYRSLRNWETGQTVPNIVNVNDLLQLYGRSFYELELNTHHTKDQKEKEKNIRAAAIKRNDIEKLTTVMTLQDMRLLSKYSRAHVATLCKASHRSIRNWEAGETIPNVVNIADMLEIYGYSFYDLDLSPFYLLAEERKNKALKNIQDVRFQNNSLSNKKLNINTASNT